MDKLISTAEYYNIFTA